MNKLVDDLSTLTSISSSKLDNLCKIASYCITEEFLETILQEKDLVEYDIGIGKLYIGIKDDQIKYKFVPDNLLAESLKTTMESKRNLFEVKIEKTLVSSIENTYKDLL